MFDLEGSLHIISLTSHLTVGKTPREVKSDGHNECTEIWVSLSTALPITVLLRQLKNHEDN